MPVQMQMQMLMQMLMLITAISHAGHQQGLHKLLVQASMEPIQAPSGMTVGMHQLPPKN